jgi:hypothetical protein
VTGEKTEGVLLDIYKKTPIAVRSAEHILLNRLGGRLSSRGLIDKTTNDVFGDTIDKAVAKMIEFPRVVLGAPSGDGLPPRAILVESEGPTYKAKSAPRCDYFGPSVREVRNWLFVGAHYRYCDAGVKTYWLKKTEFGNLYITVRSKQAAETEGFWEKIANQGVTLPPPP